MPRIASILRDMVTGFFADDALTRAAGIAYFTLFSLGPLLFIASGVAGLVWGEAEVNTALREQLEGMLGGDAARTVNDLAQGAMGEARGGLALAIGLGTLLLAASGAFGALQGALNAVWKVEAPAAATTRATITNFMRAKAAALGLVATTAFLLLVSLAASAAITAMGGWLTGISPLMAAVVTAANVVVSIGVITLLFAAIYKILPERRLQWRDVLAGALCTALLFTAGKSLIGFYIGQAGVARGFGAAGTLVVVLLWIYYSAVIFLLGAEFTRAWSGKEAARPEDATGPVDGGGQRPAVIAAAAAPASAEATLLTTAALGLGAVLLGRMLLPARRVPVRVPGKTEGN